MAYKNLLEESTSETRSIVCMGMDPLLERIPIKSDDTEAVLVKFYTDILDNAAYERQKPATVKPNYAFYAQYGSPGLRALYKLIRHAQSLKIPVILDAKQGDIGTTSAAYAKGVFENWGADAVTIAPYMGSDSVGPFITHAEKQGKGVYILCRTSNKGAADLQNLTVVKDGVSKPLYLFVAGKIVEWGKNANGNVGAVVGATSLPELEDISRYFVETGQEVPLLIPGVGGQGGEADQTTERLVKTRNRLAIHRINSSSGINYAYERMKDRDYAGAAVQAIRELNKTIDSKLKDLNEQI